MKTAYVCTHCGSANVVRDAWVHVNDPDNIQDFDAKFCRNCEMPCDTLEVEVADDFDVIEGQVELIAKP